MVYRFSDLELDLGRHLLTRDGEPVKLTKLSFKMLQALVQAAPELLSHDELIDLVWGPDRVITPDNLSQRMKTLRQSLGDDPNNPRYIESVRGEGYRLVPEVSLKPPGAPGRATGLTWPLGFVASLVVILLGLLTWLVVDRLDFPDDEQAVSTVNTSSTEPDLFNRQQYPAIAILPFENLSAEPSNQFFTDGIHDDLLTRISKIRGIKTISRTSVMTYRGSGKKVRTIAQELGVGTILEGGVQRTGNMVRINLQLIDAETDVHLWAETYNRKLSATNLFVIQSEIAEAVAATLQTVLSEGERKQVEKVPTTKLQALNAYFLGTQYYNHATSEGYSKAVESYQTAIEFDPEFEPAYSKQAMALLEQVWFSGHPNETQLEMSKPLIDQAILLDPQSSEAFTALGKWYAHSGDIGKAEQAYKQALALGPNNAFALVNYGHLLHWNKSDAASAIELYSKASELDPQNISLKVHLAEATIAVGQADKGIRILERAIDENRDSPAVYRVLALLYSNGKYRHDKGIRASRKAFELDPKHPQNSMFNAVMHWRLADYSRTVLWMNNAARLVPDTNEARVYRGWAFIAQGDFESAREEFYSSDSNSGLFWLGIFHLGGLDTAAGRPGDAIARYEEYATDFFDGSKSNVTFSYGIAAIKAYLALGQQEEAQALIAELMSILEEKPLVTYHDYTIHEASLYAMSGQVEAAIAILEEWVDRGGATALLQQHTRHGLGVLADDPRYQTILLTVDNRLREQRANLDHWESSGKVLPMPIEVTDPQ